MRLRLAVLMAAVTALAAVVAPGVANAAPRHNHGLTINATPNPIISGDGVLIYGQLNGANSGGQRVVLFHRVNPAGSFTRIGATKTNAQGFYEFTRAEGVVLTNRSWFVRAPLRTGNVHSRTVHERVAAALSIAASAPSGDTGHPVTFSGHVDPVGFHVGERVYLQQQALSGDDWHTLKSGVIGPSSNYSIPYRFRTAGARDVRILFGGDDRNIGAVSDSLTVTIQQNQNPSFTINTSAPVVDEHAGDNLRRSLRRAGERDIVGARSGRVGDLVGPPPRGPESAPRRRHHDRHGPKLQLHRIAAAERRVLRADDIRATRPSAHRGPVRRGA